MSRLQALRDELDVLESDRWFDSVFSFMPVLMFGMGLAAFLIGMEWGWAIFAGLGLWLTYTSHAQAKEKIY